METKAVISAFRNKDTVIGSPGRDTGTGERDHAGVRFDLLTDGGLVFVEDRGQGRTRSIVVQTLFQREAVGKRKMFMVRHRKTS